MAFWKRKKEAEYISLGLNREATAEEKKIAERRDEGPDPDIFDKLKDAVASPAIRSPSGSMPSSAGSEKLTRRFSTS